MVRVIRLLALGLASLTLPACVTPDSYDPVSYKLHPGPVRPASDIAIVRLGDAEAAEFDGRFAARGDWTEVHLAPGEHTIKWQTEFMVSVLIEPSGFSTGGNETKVLLVAGHVYTLRADRTTGPGYRMYFWIHDETTQQVVAGHAKP